MCKLLALGILIAVCASARAGEVTLSEKVSYGGWPNCLHLKNDHIELIITTDVGPRIIRFGFIGGDNLFKEFEADMGQTGGDEWRPYGGHRLWHAPEVKPRTYSPDNSPIEYEWDGTTVTITQPTESNTGIQKVMAISLDADANHVHVLHRLINRNLWSVRLAPWALTMMAQHGRAIFPDEPFRAHTDYLLPARPLVLWHYTDMSDARWAVSYTHLTLPTKRIV